MQNDPLNRPWRKSYPPRFTDEDIERMKANCPEINLDYLFKVMPEIYQQRIDREARKAILSSVGTDWESRDAE